jgi:hypothetical protein
MLYEPSARVVGVIYEPCVRRAETKRVAPGIHVGTQRVCSQADMPRQHDLQVAHRVLFGVVTASIGMQSHAPLHVHADDVRRLVQRGVDGRVGTRVHDGIDDARLRLAPVAPGERGAAVEHDELEAVARQQRAQRRACFGVAEMHGGI